MFQSAVGSRRTRGVGACVVWIALGRLSGVGCRIYIDIVMLFDILSMVYSSLNDGDINSIGKTPINCCRN